MPDKTDYPASALASHLTGDQKPCRFCDQVVAWGYTNTGKRAPFDPVPPYVNHFITCTKLPVKAKGEQHAR